MNEISRGAVLWGPSCSAPFPPCSQEGSTDHLPRFSSSLCPLSLLFLTLRATVTKGQGEFRLTQQRTKIFSHHDSVAYVLGKHSNTQTWASYLFLPACCCTANEIRKATGFQQRRHSSPAADPALLTPLLLMSWFFLLTRLLLEPHSVYPNKKGWTALLAGDMEFRVQHFTRP